MQSTTPTSHRSERGGVMRYRGTPVSDLSREELIIAVEMLYAAWEESRDQTARVLGLMRQSMEKARAT